MNTTFTDRLHIKELEETLTNSAPLLAMVGAGDLAVEKFRAAREELTARRASFDPKAFREQAQTTFAERLEALQAEMQAAPEQLKGLPERAQDLPVKAQELQAKAQEWPARAQALLADMVATAFSLYGDLAGRGKTVVSSVRGEPSVVEHTEPVTRPATTSPKAGTSTAKKPAAKKPAAKKSPSAKKTTAKKSTTKTAASSKTTPKATDSSDSSASQS